MSTPTTKPKLHDEHVKENIARIDTSINNRYQSLYNLSLRNESNDITYLREIQLLGEDIEERMKLVGSSDFGISLISSYIVKGFKARAFPERYIHYVYDAFDPPQYRKYLHRIDHSSIHEVSSISNRREQCATRFEIANDLLTKLENMLNPDLMEREQNQDIFDKLITVKEKFGKDCESRMIALSEIKQKDLLSIKDKFDESMHITKPVPVSPTSLKEEIEKGWIKEFFPHYLKKHETYPDPADPEGVKIAEAWRALRFMFEPTIDDKYRKMWPEWFKITDHAEEWFKHSAATKSRTKDFKGVFRDLTREQIGARQVTMKQIAAYLVDKLPPLFEDAIWFKNNKEPYLAEFSNRLGPKLSDRSIR